MPGKKNTSKPRGAMAEAANDKNDRTVAAVLAGAPGNFARVEKNLGSYFKLIYHDGEALHEDIQGEPRGIFSARGKVRVRIAAGDIVLLEGVQRLSEAKARGKTLIVEIVGRLGKKEAQQLYRAKRLHAKVYSGEQESSAVDDLFDWSASAADEDESDEAEDEVEIQANIKRGKVIRARKMVSSAEKSTGRGSGGIQGRGAAGGRQSAAKTAKEQLDAVAYSAGIRTEHEEDLAEEDLEALAEGLGMAPSDKKPKKVSFAESAPVVAPVMAVTTEEEPEEKPVNLKSCDNWEDAADELDIDAI
jgi:hypothetical protein